MSDEEKLARRVFEWLDGHKDWNVFWLGWQAGRANDAFLTGKPGAGPRCIRSDGETFPFI